MPIEAIQQVRDPQSILFRGRQLFGVRLGRQRFFQMAGFFQRQAVVVPDLVPVGSLPHGVRVEP
jgi:hypothetical protein